MAYKSNQPLFRSLTDTEEAEFVEYGRTNNPPNDAFNKYGNLIDEKWKSFHPVVREEWIKRGIMPNTTIPPIHNNWSICLLTK